MKRLALLVLLMAAPAWAQQRPQEVVTDQKVDLVVGGQPKVFRFKDPIARIEFVNKDIAEATVQNDRQFSITGKTPGVTRLIVSTPDGKELYDAEVFVSPDRGRLVRIYGTGKNDDVNAGFVSVFCDEFGCSRPDKDLPAPTSVTVNRHTYRGSGAPAVRPPPGGAGF